jgi:hypothetical protein
LKIYVAMINDTHSDTEPYLFTTPEAAIEYARGEARSLALMPDDLKEEQIPGWLYYCRYSPDSSVWVLEREVFGSPAEMAFAVS